MEAFIALLLLIALVALIVPIVISATNASRLRAVESAIKKFSERLSALEAEQGTGSAAKESAPAAAVPRATPPPLPAFVSAPTPATPPSLTSPKPLAPAIDWEAFMGVKLFAWIGGFVFFLGVVFLVKYSFDNNLITPRMRIVLGALIGLGLIVAGWQGTRKKYGVPGQSLCATGILVLYADIYAAHSFYFLFSLTIATALMWIVTGAALVLAAGANAQSVAWLGVLGGFLTPVLLRTQNQNAIALFTYIGILDCAVAALAAIKRWHHLLLLAAIASVVMEFAWAAKCFGPVAPDTARMIFLGGQALFLAICVVRASEKETAGWNIAAGGISGFAPLVYSLTNVVPVAQDWSFVFPIVLLSDAGLIALAGVYRYLPNKSQILAGIIAGALIITGFIEWNCIEWISGLNHLVGWHVAIFLLFACVPYVCGTGRFWTWLIAAVTGPMQFWFVYQLLEPRWLPHWKWLLPLAFALVPALGVTYLIKKERVVLASGDSRLATQSAALLAFISLVFPVQFEREWITLGWALQGVALLLLFRRLPNRQLQIFSLLVFVGAFVRLAFNPAVLEYHARTPIKIWNWYLYAYGITAIAFFVGARLFRSEREHPLEQIGPPLLYSLGTILLFLLLNIEIADYFSIGPTLTFSFSGNFARDMTYSIAWAIFAFALLMIGMKQKAGAVRYAGLALLLITLAKLFLHDLGSLNQLYRIGAFIGVALILIVASFLYQRFLAPAAKSE